MAGTPKIRTRTREREVLPRPTAKAHPTTEAVHEPINISLTNSDPKASHKLESLITGKDLTFQGEKSETTREFLELKKPIKLRDGPQTLSGEIKIEPKPRQNGLFRRLWHRLKAAPLPIPLPMPMMILMGFLARWGNTRGTLKKDHEVFMIFDENQTNFTLGRAGPGHSKGFIGMDSPYVDPLHAQIAWDPFQGVTLIDRGSRHGTWVWQGNRWRSLDAFSETPLTAEQHVAFGLVYPQRDQIILNPNLAVQLILRRGGDPNVWALSKNFHFPNKKLIGKDVIDVDLSLLPSSLESQGILKKIVQWITRPEPTEYELQMIAEEFNQAGLFEEAGLLHQKAADVARKKLFYSMFGTEEHGMALESLAKTSAHYGDFLLSRERLREAALQYIAAAEAIVLYSKDEQAILMRLALQNKAYYIYMELAQQAEKRGVNLEAANYLERAGINIPWVFDLQSSEGKWEPGRHAIYCFARAALHYKKLGYRFSDDLERALMDLNKVPLYLEEAGVGSKGMRSLVYRISQSIRDNRVQFEDLDRLLADPDMKFSLEP